MKCPTCPDTALVMMDRQGVEIDYCPQCRGVWLDRGELDKLIDRAATAAPSSDRNAVARSQPGFVDSDYRGSRNDRDDRNHRHDGDSRNHHNSRRKSWLSDIFN